MADQLTAVADCLPPGWIYAEDDYRGQLCITPHHGFRPPYGGLYAMRVIGVRWAYVNVKPTIVDD